MDFDLIISSLPQHWESFQRLKEMHQPDAKHIFHMGPGNVEWEVPAGCKNVMHHGPLFNRSGLNEVSYCQEFDTDVFCYEQPVWSPQTVYSYVHWPESEQLWKDMGVNWKFEFIGKTLGSLDDTVVETERLAHLMKESKFTWHMKPGGESYGHIIHNSYACGRPAIVNMKDYENTRAGKLFTDMETCVDMTDLTPGQLREKIYIASEWNAYTQMCQVAHDRFKQVVDFDEDEIELRAFFERVQ